MKIELNEAFGILDRDDPLGGEKTFEVIVTIDRDALSTIRSALIRYAKTSDDFADIADAVDVSRAIIEVIADGRQAARDEYRKAVETSELAKKMDAALQEFKAASEAAGGTPNAEAFIRFGAVLEDLKNKGVIDGWEKRPK